MSGAPIIYRASEAIPDVQAYVFALAQPFVKHHHRTMLTAHASAPGWTMTAGALAAAAGYVDWRRVNHLYGALGHQVSDLLGMRPAVYSKGPLWTTAFAEGWSEGQSSRARWCWRLYPEVAAALEQLGWVVADAASDTDPIG